jgi:hypothetical protein
MSKKLSPERDHAAKFKKNLTKKGSLSRFKSGHNPIQTKLNPSPLNNSSLNNSKVSFNTNITELRSNQSYA